MGSECGRLRGERQATRRPAERKIGGFPVYTGRIIPLNTRNEDANRLAERLAKRHGTSLLFKGDDRRAR
jgi:hypothetical protein